MTTPLSTVVTEVLDAGSSTQLAAASAYRSALKIFNRSSQPMWINHVGAASSSSNIAMIAPFTCWEMKVTPPYTGAINGIWANDAEGVAVVYDTTADPTTFQMGPNPLSSYPVEIGQNYAALTSDQALVRVRAVASVDPSRVGQFWGVSAIRVEAEDAAGVIDGTDPYLYGIRVRVVPRAGRNNSGIDDVVGVQITNKSFGDLGTVFNGTEALYIGHSGGATKDWNAGVGIDTIADNGMYIVRGPYQYGILMTGSVTTAAIRIPNNAKIVARNQADGANLDMLFADTGNNLRLASSGVKVAVGAPNAPADVVTHFEVHGLGVTDGNVGGSHLRVVDTSAFAANEGGTITLAGWADATPNVRTYAGITGRKANATSGNTAGYLGLWSRNSATGLVEVLRLTELQKVLVTEGVDFTLGTTTGTKIGSTTSDKLGFWNKTPVVQPTTAVVAATFVANTSAIANDTATFDGYTIGKVVAALRSIGILA